MKGIIFRSLLDFVEHRFGDESAEKMIDDSGLANGAVYTTVGTYDPAELHSLIDALSKATGIEAAALLREFGVALFAVLADRYSEMLQGAEDAFSLIRMIDDVIHVQVLKLYPDAALPVFRAKQESPRCMLLKYQSIRALPELAEGLLIGCFSHFDEEVEIEWEDQSGGDKSSVLFKIRLKEKVDE